MAQRDAYETVSSTDLYEAEGHDLSGNLARLIFWSVTSAVGLWNGGGRVEPVGTRGGLGPHFIPALLLVRGRNLRGVCFGETESVCVVS